MKKMKKRCSPEFFFFFDKVSRRGESSKDTRNAGKTKVPSLVST